MPPEVPPDPGPVVQRARLTAELQRLRRERHKTQEEVARALDWSPSKLIRIEGGSVGISTTDLQALLRLYGVADADLINELEVLARGARRRGWWAPFKNELDQATYTYIGYEAGASIIRSFEPLLVPGPLQTDEYAAALTIEYITNAPSLVDSVVDARMRRQEELLNRENPPKQEFILDEAVIRRRVGGQRDPGIMPRQLRHLLDSASLQSCIIEVIPFVKGSHFGMRGSFTLLEFDVGLNSVLYLENSRVRGGEVTGAAGDVAAYLEAFEHLRELAMSPEESASFIQEVAEGMEGGFAAA